MIYHYKDFLNCGFINLNLNTETIKLIANRTSQAYRAFFSKLVLLKGNRLKEQKIYDIHMEYNIIFGKMQRWLFCAVF